MTNPAERLVDLLDLEQIEVNIFRGRSPRRVPPAGLRRPGRRARRWSPPAAPRTATVRCTRCTRTSCARAVPGVPIVYQVERVRDGRSFTTRRVTAVQQGRTIFNLTASFHQPEEGGFEHQLPPARKVPDPESLPTSPTRSGSISARCPSSWSGWRAVSPSTSAMWTGCAGPPRRSRTSEPRSAVWMRAVGPLGDDPLVHTCALTYASDMTLLDAVRHPGRAAVGPAELRHGLAGPRHVVPPAVPRGRVVPVRPGVADRHGRPRAGPRPDLRPSRAGCWSPWSRRGCSGSWAEESRVQTRAARPVPRGSWVSAPQAAHRPRVRSGASDGSCSAPGRAGCPAAGALTGTLLLEFFVGGRCLFHLGRGAGRWSRASARVAVRSARSQAISSGSSAVVMRSASSAAGDARHAVGRLVRPEAVQVSALVGVVDDFRDLGGVEEGCHDRGSRPRIGGRSEQESQLPCPASCGAAGQVLLRVGPAASGAYGRTAAGRFPCLPRTAVVRRRDTARPRPGSG